MIGVFAWKDNRQVRDVKSNDYAIKDKESNCSVIQLRWKWLNSENRDLVIFCSANTSRNVVDDIWGYWFI